MNKKLAAALSGGAVLVMALSACSSDDGNEKLDAWAKQVCDAVPAQNTKITAAYAAITKAAKDTTSTPENLQKTDSQAFQDLADGYKARATVLTEAGAPPDIEDGAKKQQDAVKKLTALSASYADLKKQIDALSTKDQGKFASGLDDISTEMEKVEQQRKTAFDSLKQLEKGDAKQALTKQTGCQKASASAPATDS